MGRRSAIPSCLVTLAMSLAGRGVAAAEPGAGPALPVGLRAAPAHLRLGVDARAALEIACDPDRLPFVDASVGRVEKLRAAQGGRCTAEYVPPDDGVPQVAIVSAVAGERVAWIAIPLTGRGIATARAKPHARVSVTIGDTSFGPAAADERGEARLSVVAPPGVRYAYNGTEPLDLKIPPTLHVHLAVDRRAARADVEARATLWAFAVLPDGAPRRGAPPRVLVSSGTVGALEEIAPGAFRAAWTLPPGPAVRATATAKLADEPAAASVGMARTAGPAASLTLDSDRPRATPDDDRPIVLRVRVADAAGNPLDESPALEASSGTPAPAGSDASARVFHLAPPARVAPGEALTVVARAGGLERRVRIALAAGAPDRVIVSSGTAAVVADGVREARARVKVVDRNGNAVDGAAPAISSMRPANVDVERVAPGEWGIRYRSSLRDPATDVVSVQAGTARGELRVEVRPAERRLALAPKLGAVVSTGGRGGVFAAAEASTLLNLAQRRLAIAVEAGTFELARTDLVAVGGTSTTVRGSARYVPILASAAWQVAWGPRRLGWIGAGGGASYVAAETSAGGGPTVRASGWAPAFRASAGAALPTRFGTPFAELAVLRAADPHLATYRGALTAFTLSVGYRHDPF